jgi:hypothetical protein
LAKFRTLEAAFSLLPQDRPSGTHASPWARNGLANLHKDLARSQKI